MIRNMFSSLTSKFSWSSLASSSGMEKGESQSTSQRAGESSSKHGPSSGPTLRRSNSLPARLPSQPHEPAEVKMVRKSIKRTEPDRRPPKDFREDGDGLHEGALKKLEFIWKEEKYHDQYRWFVNRIVPREKLVKFLKSVHPKFDEYNQKQKAKAYQALAASHPKIAAEFARWRNENWKIPNSATSTRCKLSHCASGIIPRSTPC